jgi:transposase
MLTEQKFYVHLTDADRAKMQDIVQQQCGSPSRILRAKILLHVDSLCTENPQSPISSQCPSSPKCPSINISEIAKLFSVSKNTVWRICSCYRNEGLRTSLYGSHFTKVVCLKNKERFLLQQIFNDPQHDLNHYKQNKKIAKILLKADQDGNNADVSEIANESGCTKMTVTKTIRSYLEKGLNGILKQQTTFYFRLRKKDRNRLQDLLKQEVTYSWNHTRAQILLTADIAGTKIVWDEIAKQTESDQKIVRKVCKKYMSEGLDSVLNLTTHRSLIPFRNYPVKLSYDEQLWLKNISETTCRKHIHRRALILLNADKNGRNLHNTDIAKLVGTNHETVRLVCKRYSERGVKDTVLCGCRDISKPAPKRTRTPKPKFYDINLKPNEKQFLQQIINSQDGTPSRINRARILLQVDRLHHTENCNKIASNIGVHDKTIYNICRRYRNGGIEAAVNHKSKR